MRSLIAAVLILLPPLAPPYVACIDGHIAMTLGDCPPPVKHVTPQTPYGGPAPRGGGGGGLLGGLLGGIL